MTPSAQPHSRFTCRVIPALLAAAALALPASLLAATPALAATPTSVTFTPSGASLQSWTVPAGVTSVTFTTTGAAGQTDSSSFYGQTGAVGGPGAVVTTTIAVKPGDMFLVYAGYSEPGYSIEGLPQVAGGTSGDNSGNGGDASFVESATACASGATGANVAGSTAPLCAVAGGGGGSGGFSSGFGTPSGSPAVVVATGSVLSAGGTGASAYQQGVGGGGGGGFSGGVGGQASPSTFSYTGGGGGGSYIDTADTTNAQAVVSAESPGTNGSVVATYTVSATTGGSTPPVVTSGTGTSTATLNPGTLSFVSTPSNLTFPAVILDGKDQTTATPLPLDVGDNTGTGAGWNVTITSTQFSDRSATLSASATSINIAPSSTCDVGSSCTPAALSSSVTYPVTIPAGATAPTATRLYSAAAGSGMGDQTFSPDFTLAVPANAAAGAHSSDWTLSLVSGP